MKNSSFNAIMIKDTQQPGDFYVALDPSGETIWICPKEFRDAYGGLFEGKVVTDAVRAILPEGFTEVGEGQLMYNGGSAEEGMQSMIDAGFINNSEMEKELSDWLG